MQDRFWVRHLVVPSVLAGAVLMLIWSLDLDRAIAHVLFHDAQRGWLGQGAGAWWARGVLHSGGQVMVRGIALLAMAAWLTSFRHARLQPYRGAAAYVTVTLLLANLLVGLLKLATNVDCPWFLSEFGGTHPYLSLFADRPPDLPAVQCFPGSHAGSGFSLMCLYYAANSAATRWRRAGLAAGLVAGCLFSLGQQARGAHFLSHDLTSALLVWIVATLMHRWRVARRLPLPTTDRVVLAH